VIDFRYHLVSIVSIFMALAVGIVLGAGPLKGDIGASLTQQVTELRAEKAQLRSDLDLARRQTSARDTFSAAVAPAIMMNQLPGKTVALLVAPGAGGDLVKSTTASLVAAGARVGSTLTLSDAWADPAKRTMRNTLANRFDARLRIPTVSGTPDQFAALVLVRAMLAGTGPTAARAPSQAAAALAALQTGGLVSVTPDQTLPSSSVVFLGGAVKGSSPQDIDARLSAYVQLVGALETDGSGVVVATESNTSAPAQSEDLVAAVRRDADAVKVISTVDDADLPMGQSTLVLALAEQYAGGNGQYGLAADAKAVVPDLTANQ
jgi:hypothetical protein